MDKKEKTKNDGQWTDARFKSFVVSQLRRASMRWPPKTQALGLARVERGVYLCAGCNQHVTASIKNEKGKRVSNVSVDHIIPVVATETGFTTWDDFVERLFCGPENLQVLCLDCHVNTKSRAERVDGRLFAKNIAEVKKLSEPTYHTWSNMNDRCQNPKATGYKYYGAKGITVCQGWQRLGGSPEGILNFVNDMGLRPEGKTLDRVDYTKNYSPENCRWASTKEQARNTSQNNWIEYKGEMKILEDWGDHLGIKANTILTRLRRGWTVGQALGFDKKEKEDYVGRLTPEDFTFIKEKLQEGWTQTKIGESLEMDESQISRITNRFNLKD